MNLESRSLATTRLSKSIDKQKSFAIESTGISRRTEYYERRI